MVLVFSLMYLVLVDAMDWSESPKLFHFGCLKLASFWNENFRNRSIRRIKERIWKREHLPVGELLVMWCGLGVSCAFYTSYLLTLSGVHYVHVCLSKFYPNFIYRMCAIITRSFETALDYKPRILGPTFFVYVLK